MAHEGAMDEKRVRNQLSYPPPPRKPFSPELIRNPHKVVDTTLPYPKLDFYSPKYLQKPDTNPIFFRQMAHGKRFRAIPNRDSIIGKQSKVRRILQSTTDTNGKWIQYADSVYVTRHYSPAPPSIHRSTNQKINRIMVYFRTKGCTTNFHR
jgi:hypothetical protein